MFTTNAVKVLNVCYGGRVRRSFDEASGALGRPKRKSLELRTITFGQGQKEHCCINKGLTLSVFGPRITVSRKKKLQQRAEIQINLPQHPHLALMSIYVVPAQ